MQLYLASNRPSNLASEKGLPRVKPDRRVCSPYLYPLPASHVAFLVCRSILARPLLTTIVVTRRFTPTPPMYLACCWVPLGSSGAKVRVSLRPPRRSQCGGGSRREDRLQDKAKVRKNPLGISLRCSRRSSSSCVFGLKGVGSLTVMHGVVGRPRIKCRFSRTARGHLYPHQSSSIDPQGTKRRCVLVRMRVM